MSEARRQKKVKDIRESSNDAFFLSDKSNAKLSLALDDLIDLPFVSDKTEESVSIKIVVAIDKYLAIYVPD